MPWTPDIDPAHEPHKVMIHKAEFSDANRGNRSIPYKIYYPVEHDYTSLPVVFWSHGLGGSRDGAGFLARFIASYGFIVINIQHAGTDSSIWEGKPGHPWDVIRATKISRQDSLNRFYDVPAILSQLDDILDQIEAIKTYADKSSLGISGHSFGALTAQIMAGQLFPDEQEQLSSLKQARFKAGILYSFNPIDHLIDTDPATLFGPMDIPLLFMTGTDDSSPLSGQDYKYRMPVYNHAGSPEKHLLVLEDGDHMVFAGSRGKLKENPKRNLHEDIIKITSLAFWQTYLRDDEIAKEWLTAGNVHTYLDKEAQYEYKQS